MVAVQNQLGVLKYAVTVSGITPVAGIILKLISLHHPVSQVQVTLLQPVWLSHCSNPLLSPVIPFPQYPPVNKHMPVLLPVVPTHSQEMRFPAMLNPENTPELHSTHVFVGRFPPE